MSAFFWFRRTAVQRAIGRRCSGWPWLSCPMARSCHQRAIEGASRGRAVERPEPGSGPRSTHSKGEAGSHCTGPNEALSADADDVRLSSFQSLTPGRSSLSDVKRRLENR